MFYSVGVFRTSDLGDSVSSNPERTALRRGGEEPGYIEVLQQWAGSLNIKRLLLIKENQISQVKEISIFLCMGRRKSLCPLKLLLSYAHHLSGASILFSYPELPFLRVHPRSGCNLMSIKCLSNGRFSFLPESIQGLPAHIGGLKSLTIVTSLFTDMAGIISFLIHYVRSFDISWGFG